MINLNILEASKQFQELLVGTFTSIQPIYWIRIYVQLVLLLNGWYVSRLENLDRLYVQTREHKALFVYKDARICL